MISFYPLKDRLVKEIEYQHYGEIFSNPVPVEFELDLLRIDRTYVIEKSQIKSFQFLSDEAKFVMKDGSVITLKLVPRASRLGPDCGVKTVLTSSGSCCIITTADQPISPSFPGATVHALLIALHLPPLYIKW